MKALPLFLNMEIHMFKKQNQKYVELYFKQYVNEAEVSEITGISKSHLQNLRWQGKGFPYYKISKKVLYKLSEVIDYMEEHRVEPANLINNVL